MKTIVAVLTILALLAPVSAQDRKSPDCTGLILDVLNKTRALKPGKKESVQALEDAVENLRTDLGTTEHKHNDAFLKTANDTLDQADAALEDQPKKSIADRIKDARPLTAVLFSGLKRDAYEVVKLQPTTDNPMPDGSRGTLSQSQSGTTAGILMAAEAPLFYPGEKRMAPVGIWFGVNLQTGGGADVSDVDLAAGFSLGWISPRTIQKATESEPSVAGGRFLLGVMYGDEASLAHGYNLGDELGISDTIPMKRKKALAVTAGLGFRF